MIKIRTYEFTDRYYFEKLIKSSYQERKIEPPNEQKILDTIGFFTTYPQCGKIYIVTYNKEIIGYSIVQNDWKIKYGRISFTIEELYINKSFRKYKPGVNLIEYLIKQEKICSILIKLDKLKTTSKKVFNFFKFERDFGPYYIKTLSNGD
jgi:hypothetical protein